MTDFPRPMWLAKQSPAGNAIRNCWQHVSGYTASLTGRPGPLRYAVTRPGDRDPFAYLGTPEEIELVIGVDRTFNSKPLSAEDFKKLELQP